MEIAITGSSGLIGTELTKTLQEQGQTVIRIVRRKPNPKANEIRWDPANGEIDAQSLEGVDAVINLAGAGIGDKRWSESYKKTLVDSRTDSTQLLSLKLASANKPTKVLISGSAIGYYGNRDADELTEDSAAGSNFLAKLCINWEKATHPAVDAGIRTCHIRTGIVLSKQGGALKKMLPLFKIGLGGKFGKGNQFMSWISITDQVNAIIYLLNSDISGPVNLTAPTPVSNIEFTKTLAKALSRPALLPVPEFGPKFLLGSELAQALLFDSQKVHPEVLTNSGYDFKHKKLKEALEEIL